VDNAIYADFSVIANSLSEQLEDCVEFPVYRLSSNFEAFSFRDFLPAELAGFVSERNLTRLITNPLVASPIAFTASTPKQKISRATPAATQATNAGPKRLSCWSFKALVTERS